MDGAKNVWGKITGKAKYVIVGIYSLVVALNKAFGWGLDEETLNRILVAVGIALGADMAEGVAANFKKEK